jgi:methyltransferase-like protein
VHTLLVHTNFTFNFGVSKKRIQKAFINKHSENKDLKEGNKTPLVFLHFNSLHYYVAKNASTLEVSTLEGSNIPFVFLQPHLLTFLSGKKKTNTLEVSILEGNKIPFVFLQPHLLTFLSGKKKTNTLKEGH